MKTLLFLAIAVVSLLALLVLYGIFLAKGNEEKDKLED